VAGTAAAVVPQLTAASATRFEATHEPKAAADYASAHLAGRRLYTVDTWGGYLAYRFPVGRVVYLYDEAGIFGNAALQQYLDIHDLRPDWASVIAANGIADAILPADAQEVSAFLTVGWSIECSDTASGSVVLSPSATVAAAPRGAAAPACA
jgi:hypothetical protein